MCVRQACNTAPGAVGSLAGTKSCDGRIDVSDLGSIVMLMFFTAIFGGILYMNVSRSVAYLHKNV